MTFSISFTRFAVLIYVIAGLVKITAVFVTHMHFAVPRPLHRLLCIVADCVVAYCIVANCIVANLPNRYWVRLPSLHATQKV